MLSIQQTASYPKYLSKLALNKKDSFMKNLYLSKYQFTSFLVSSFIISLLFSAQVLAQNIPDRGMSQVQVEAKFGTATKRNPAVGVPPITRWDYESFSVYFEHSKVLHSFSHSKIMNVKAPMINQPMPKQAIEEAIETSAEAEITPMENQSSESLDETLDSEEISDIDEAVVDSNEEALAETPIIEAEIDSSEQKKEIPEELPEESLEETTDESPEESPEENSTEAFDDDTNRENNEAQDDTDADADTDTDETDLNFKETESEKEIDFGKWGE